MQLTETRKDIIKLVDSYMNKTLSEWCLVKDPSNQIAKIISIHENFYNVYYIWIWLGVIARNCSLEIIWHYDITAVLKHFRKLWIFIWFLNETNEITLYNNKYDCLDWKNSIWRFPEKPLHLYDTNEEENLLKLLQSLNK
jgi:hypothetical protein